MATTSNQPLQITCLGRVQIVYDGELLSNNLLKKAQALLIYLALEPGRHDRESLAALLWSDSSGESARANLRTVLNRLRRPLDAYLDTHRQTVAFVPDAPFWFDVARFEQGLSQGTTAGQRAALDLYQGDFLAGWNVPAAPLFDEWALLKREYLRDIALTGLAKLAESALAAGDDAQAIRDLRRLLALDPWREAGHRALMRALAASGDRAAALAQYDACRRILAEELAVEPAPETETLYRQIKAGRLAEANVARPSPAHNLPAETTPFVGRQAELKQITGLLAPANTTCRLLTLFGPGGIGKTRLALQAARRMQPAFADGVYLVSLETVGSAELLATAIATALNLRLTGQSSPEAQLLAYVRERELLLLLDNFEHLLAGSDFLVTLLEHAPGVKLLVTSREALNLYEEWLLAVEGLSYPPEGSPADPTQFDAVSLFQQRARQTLLDFSLAQNEAAVGEICRLLLGMPLGIELAAAWVRTIACAEIARQIAANLAVLSSALRNVPPRHRSMVAVFDHSWELLRPAERQLLRQLSVFRGGFSADAAYAIAGAGRRDLSSLADKALLRVIAPGRYDLHPLIRQYVADKLAAHPEEQAESRSRHLAYFAAFVGAEETAVTNRDQQAALTRIAADLDNVRQAWAAAVAQPHTGYLNQMVGALFHVYGKRGLHQEGFQQFGRAIEAVRPLGPSPLLARLLVRQGRLGENISRDYTISQALFSEALALAREHQLPVEAAQATMGLGFLALIRGQIEQAGTYLTESVAICRQHDIPWTLANVLHFLAWVRNAEGERATAKAMADEALALHQEADDTIGVASAFTTLGKIHSDAGDFPAAEAAYAEAYAICRQNGHQVGAGQALTGLFTACYRQGNLEKAAVFAQQSLAVNRDVGNRLGMAIAHHNLGFLSAEQGQHRPAVEHYRQALALYEAIEADEVRQRNTRQHLAESLKALGEVEVG